jgi:hypothetical protein
LGADCRREDAMFDFRDLFQWDRFITPSIIKVFYLLAVLITVLVGLQQFVGGLMIIRVSPVSGLVTIVASIIGSLAVIIFIRIAAEFVLITFRINEHLGALRNRAEM